MRLFEIAGSKFTDDLANLLKVMQGRANSERTQSLILWPAINNLLRSHGHGEVDQDMLTRIKDQVDPSNQLIQDVNEKGIVLKTDSNTPEPATPTNMPAAKSIDRMASNAASRELK